MKKLVLLGLFITYTGVAISQSVVVNKYQNATVDRVELLVITNNLDMRGMIIKDHSSSMANDGGGKYEFATSDFWSSIKSGTLIVLRNDNTAPDIDATDYSIEVGLSNTTYFTSLGGTFDIATTEFIAIKTAGSGSAGTTGMIHGLAGGTPGTQFNSAPVPKLIATGTSGTNNFVFANNSTSSINDFNGSDATGATPSLTFGSANNSANNTYIAELRASSGGNPPPSISNMLRSETIPAAGVNFSISADVSDNESVSAVFVRFSKNGGNLDSTEATLGSGTTYSASIDASSLANGDLFAYSVSATDNDGAYTKNSTQQVFIGTTPISTIRQNDANGLNIHTSILVKVAGVASYLNGVLGGANMDWYLEDETAGVNIFKFGDNTFSITVGNEYSVIGTITQFNGRLEVVPSATSDIMETGIGSLPNPVTTVVPSLTEFLSSPEQLEGSLVSFKNVSVSGGTWPIDATFTSTLLVTDDGGSSTIQLYINSETGGPEQTGSFDILGVIRQNDNTSPYNASYQIVPRNSSDFYPANTLPVELSSFTVSASGKSALLKWETTTEKSNAGFEVLKSSDKKTWNSMAFINGKGTTTEKQVYSYSDKNVTGTVYYRLKQVDTDGTATLSEILSFNGTPAAFEVSGNYPNPFNPATTIRFTLPVASPVVVKVHNIIGQQIATLVNGKLEAGLQEIPFDASGLASGVYFYSVSANGKTITKSMTLMK